MRVLIVDDHEEARLAMSELLQLQGHDLVTASDGRSALEAVLSLQPDVVLLDVRLKSESGFDVARTLTSTVAGLHVVLMSMDGRLAPAAVQASGARSFIVKESLAGTDLAVLLGD